MAIAESNLPAPALKREPAEGRVEIVDVIRGICLVLMTIDHIPANLIQRFSNMRYSPFGLFTGAEGFVFLSGWIIGRVYGRVWQVSGPRVAIQRVLNRLGTIYIAQLTLYVTLLAAVLMHLPGTDRWHQSLMENDPWKALALGVVLLHAPKFFDVLPLYIAFLVCTPFLLWQIKRGRMWTILVVSGAVWGISGALIRFPKDANGIDMGWLSPLGYQFLYVIGLVFGENWKRFSSFKPSRLFIAFSGAFTLLCFLVRMGLPVIASAKVAHDIDNLASIRFLGPLRLLSFATFAITLTYFFQNAAPIKFDGFPARWLKLLGRHSLQIFAWSILVAYFLMAVLPPHPSVLVRAVDLIVGVASLSIPAMIASKNWQLFPVRAMWTAKAEFKNGTTNPT